MVKNESGFRPPLCTYRLNWARRASWGWWDDLDDTVLQTQDSKLEPWRSEAEHATSRSRRLPTILTFTRGWRRNIFCFFQTAGTGNRTPNSGVKGSGANHYPRAPARMVRWIRWHCPPDTGFEILTLEVWGRARYLSVTEVPHNTEFYEWMGKEHFCFFRTAETWKRTPHSSVKGSCANHYPRVPALTAVFSQEPDDHLLQSEAYDLS